MAGDSDKSDKDNDKSKALDLFADKEQKVADRKRAREEAAQAKAQAEQDATKAAEDAKAAAKEAAKEDVLDLLEEQEEKAARKAASGNKAPKEGSAEDILPPISLLKEEEKEAMGLTGGDAGEDADVSIDDSDEGKIIHIKPPIMVETLAECMGLKPFKLIKELMDVGVFTTAKGSIEADVATEICEKHGFTFEREKREKGAGVHKVEEVIEEPPEPEPVEKGEEEIPVRAPIVTFMGHVDHGKTSLLDAIRKAKVTDGEAGGITQHIGAYTVEREGKPVTFIDTPGHAAFAQMRARGANATDIVVLVVAADDGFMPQTIEAMNHAKAAEVTIIIAINKMDVPGANPNRVKGQLQQHELSPVDLGGDVECVECSAETGDGVDDLMDTILLQAEVMELRATPDGPARATVIEATVEPGRGPTATAIIRSGTLKNGKPFICGPYHGKVKSMLDDMGNLVKEAGPATAIQLLGFSDIPHVGDEVVEMKSDREAKKLAEERQDERRKDKLVKKQKTNLEDFMASIEEGARKILNVVLKTDVQGTAEAVASSLEEIKSDKIRLNILHAAAGAITESDILLASASDAIVIGFNTKTETKAAAAAKREGVQLKLYSIIYELLDQVEEAMLGMLDPETRENIIGHAEVKQVFKLSKGGRVAGCIVTDGRINRAARARVLRDGQPIYDGNLATLRRFQEDVKEVRNGLECGIKLGKYTEYVEEDIIECYTLEKVAQTL